MGKYQSMKEVAAEFRFDNRADYLHARFLAYDLHIKVLPSLTKTDDDGVLWTRMFVSAPEYLIWTLMHQMDKVCLFYTTPFGLLVE